MCPPNFVPKASTVAEIHVSKLCSLCCPHNPNTSTSMLHNFCSIKNHASKFCTLVTRLTSITPTKFCNNPKLQSSTITKVLHPKFCPSISQGRNQHPSTHVPSTPLQHQKPRVEPRDQPLPQVATTQRRLILTLAADQTLTLAADLTLTLAADLTFTT